MMENEIASETDCYVCRLKFLRDRESLMASCALVESETGIRAEDVLEKYMAWYHQWHMEMENNA